MTLAFAGFAVAPSATGTAKSAAAAVRSTTSKLLPPRRRRKSSATAASIDRVRSRPGLGDRGALLQDQAQRGLPIQVKPVRIGWRKMRREDERKVDPVHAIANEVVPGSRFRVALVALPVKAIGLRGG